MIATYDINRTSKRNNADSFDWWRLRQQSLGGIVLSAIPPIS